MSKNKDRPLAISGLEKRMIESLHEDGGIHGGYGILDGRKTEFQSFLGRSLLWIRGSESPLRRIIPQAISIPTWSWMAYEGQIDYMHPDFGQVFWNTDRIEPPWNIKSESPVWHTGSFNGPKLTAYARDFAKRQGDQIFFDDNSSKPCESLKYVLIGTLKPTSFAPGMLYVLIIASKTQGQGSQTWERVGVGALNKRSVHGAESQVQIA